MPGKAHHLAFIALLVLPARTHAAAGTLECEVVFSAESPSRVSGLTFEASYANAGGSPIGEGVGVACSGMSEDDSGPYNDIEARSVLRAAFLNVEGVEGRFDVARCRFAASEAFSAQAIAIEVTNAVDASSRPVHPSVFVGDVRCSSRRATFVAASETPACAGSYDVTFGVTGERSIGALQLMVDYSDASGELLGSGAEVACKPDVSVISVFNDKDSLRALRVGLMAPSGFASGPGLFTCRFVTNGKGPAPSDFAVVVTDTATPEGDAIRPVPTVAVSSIVRIADEECGSGPAGGDEIVQGPQEPAGAETPSTQVHDPEAQSEPSPADDPEQALEPAQAAGGNGDSAPEPLLDPEPLPEPLPDPRSAPADETLPSPVVDREPTSEPQPEPVPPTVLDVEPVPAPIPTPEPQPAATPEPMPETESGPASEPERVMPTVCGDADASGMITARDAGRALKRAAGVESACALSICDVDSSGAITALDARVILDAAVGRAATLRCTPLP